MEVNDPIGTRHAGCSYTDYLESRGWLAEHQAYIQEWVDQMRSGEVRPWDQRPSPVPEGEDIDSFIGSNVVRWLERHDGEQPFYLQAQFTGPHDPFDGPLAYTAPDTTRTNWTPGSPNRLMIRSRGVSAPCSDGIAPLAPPRSVSANAGGPRISATSR